jgi:hypothetical protein
MVPSARLGLAHWISLWLLQAALTDTVAVESEPRAAELDQVLLDGCNSALGSARCSVAGAPAAIGSPAPTWFVRVRWEPDGRRARVEFRRGDAAGELTETREVEFAPADNDAQRHKAVGLIIAAYVLAEAKARAEAAAATPPEPKDDGKAGSASPPRPGSDSDADSGSDADADSGTVITIAPDLVPPRRPPDWAIDVLLLAGPGFDRGPPRFGLQLRGLAWPLSLPLAGTASVRAAQRFTEPTVRWLSGTLGLIWLPVPQLSTAGLELRAEAVLQNVRIEADPPEGAAGSDSQAGDAWRFGAAGGADAWLQLGGGIALLTGFELTLLQPRVYLDIGGDAAGNDPALAWSATFGFRAAR